MHFHEILFYYAHVLTESKHERSTDTQEKLQILISNRI